MKAYLLREVSTQGKGKVCTMSVGVVTVGVGISELDGVSIFHEIK